MSHPSPPPPEGPVPGPLWLLEQELLRAADPGAALDRLRASRPELAAALRELAGALPVFVWTARPDGSVDYESARWAAYTGRSPEEALGWGWASALHPDDVGRAREAWERAVAGGRPYASEHRIRRADGAYLWHLARGVPVLDGQGRVSRWVGATADVDDRKRDEAAARRRGRWLETVLQSVGDGLIATGPAGDVRLINPAAQALTGWGARDAVGRPLGEVFRIVDEATRRPLECPGTAAIREGRAVGVAESAVLVARDGTERPVDDSGAPIRADDGSLLGGVLCFRDVSLRRRAEEARARLAAIVESSDDAIIGEDLDGTIVSWNEGARRIYGYAPEEAIGRSIAMLIPPDRLAETADALAAVHRGEHVHHIETRRVRKDGSAVDVSVSVSPICDRHGRVVGLSKIARDITERKRAEEALRRSEGQLRLALQAARMGAWERDLMTDRIAWSADDEFLLGLEPGVYPFQELRRQWLHPEDRGPLDEAMEQARRERAPYSREVRFVLPDGSIRWMLTRGRYVYDEAGAAVRMVGITMDITERKRAEEALRAREEQLRLALEAARMAAWDRDRTGRVTFSVADETIFGVAPGTYDYGELLQGVHPADQEPAEQEFERAWRERAPLSLEVRQILPDGSIRWVLTRGRCVHDEAGAAVRMLGVSMDVTERRRAEEALRAREEQLRMALEAARMAAWEHDLRTGRVTLSVTDETVFGDAPGTYDHEQLLQRVHPADQGLVEQEFERARREQAPFSFEVRHIQPDGSMRWVLTRGRYVHDEAGQAGRMLGITMDVTERKRAEEALRQSERQFRAVFLASRDGIIIADEEGRYTDANPAAGELFGLPSEEMVGRSIVEFMEPGFDFAAVWEEFRRRGGRSGTFRLVRPDGAIREVEDSATADFLPGRHMAILHDVTERNRAEAALRRFADRLASLREIDRAILATRRPAEIARIALRQLARLVPCWRGSVALIDLEAREGRILASVGALSRRMSEGTSRPLSAIGEAALEMLIRGEPHVVDDLQELASPSDHLEFLRESGARSFACIPLAVRGRLIGSINLSSDRPGAYAAEDVEIIREVSDQMAIALENARLDEENRLARGRLEMLSRRLIRAQEDERKQIARGLHDEIGQALTAVKLNLQAARKAPAGRASRLEDCIAIVDEALQRVRGMALDLRPSLLDDLGLVTALEWYVERHARRTGMQGRFVADPEEIRTTPEIETACFRIAQEALTNVARHARAGRFSVELSQHNGGLELIIRDDGCGFDPAEALERAARGTSLGLLGMIERAELAGGKLAFVSAPGEGTEVQASFPASAPAPPESGPEGVP